jgi:hypothetical protein
MPSASAGVLESGRVGPDPTAVESAPTTSAIKSVTVGTLVAARRPPFLRNDRCRRTVFISSIGRPARKRTV